MFFIHSIAYNPDINVFSALKIHKNLKKKILVNYKYTYNVHYIIKYRPICGQKIALNLNLVLDLTCPKPVRNMVFFKLFPSYFYDLSLALFPLHSFLSVSFFKRKDNTRAIDPMM